ncbi:VanZ family protein [Natronobacillus azotifigens]|uniref:VanZ family protein n=1 Tax=Natronobacillus azotifigens TaxID=472978 RepID=UPI003AF0E335
MIHVIKFTLLPIMFTPFPFPASVQLIPFYFVFDSIESGYIGSAYWQNFILLFPLGVFSPLLFRRLRNLKLTILTAFFVSTSIETIQLIMSLTIGSNRTFNVDDIILNTSGAIIGYFIYKILIITLRKFKNSYLLNKFDFGL